MADETTTTTTTTDASDVTVATDISDYGTTENLLTTLNSDDTMSMTLRVITNDVILRSSPATGSTAVATASEDDEYETTKQWKGWFYIPTANGWVQSTYVIVIAITRDYDPETDDEYYSESVTTDSSSEYDAKSIVNAIVNSIYKIPTSSIVHRRYDSSGAVVEETLLSVLIEQIFTIRDELSETVEKVGEMPKIPALPTTVSDDNVGLTLVSYYDEDAGEYAVKWAKVSYNNLEDLPTDDSVTEASF